MTGFKDIVNGLKELGINQRSPVIAHINPLILNEIKGGTKTLLGALLAAADNLVLPAFTSCTQVIPETGADNNAIVYGSGLETNLLAEIFQENLPADELYRDMARELFQYPQAKRSSHPILSFMGLGLNAAMTTQDNLHPYAPIESLQEMEGMAILVGVDQTWNFSLHFAEFLAGRKQFIRWGLTKEGVQECRPFPGCPDGFTKINRQLESCKTVINLANMSWQVFSIRPMIEIATNLIKRDPFSMLCNRLKCERCNAVRRALRDG